MEGQINCWSEEKVGSEFVIKLKVLAGNSDRGLSIDEHQTSLNRLISVGKYPLQLDQEEVACQQLTTIYQLTDPRLHLGEEEDKVCTKGLEF